MPQPDRAAFDMCLQDMRNAPRDHAPITHLNFRSEFGKRTFTKALSFDREKGVIGDRWIDHAWLRTQDGAPDPRVQVAIIPTRLLNLVWTGGTEPPHPGDTIAADMDLSEDNLPIGARLNLGSATVEVSDVFNDGCVKWKARYGHDAYDWARDPKIRKYNPRGIYCKIVQSGEVSITDKLIKV